MEGLWKWTYEDRLMTLKQIVSESRHKDPSAAVAAIAEYNRMMEAFARNPGLLQEPKPDNKTSTLPNVFSPATLAKRWNCSERHIRRMISDNELPSFRVGTLIRIKTSDVVEYEYRTHSRRVEPREAEAAIAEPEETTPRKRKKPAPRLDTPILRARWKLMDKQGS